MSKKITITFYNPKELWEMFWDRFFWPRRKQCAEWCEFGRYQMEEEIMSEVLDKVDKVLDTGDMIRLEMAIKDRIKTVFEKMKILMETP